MGEVKLSMGLDDFISPSAACIKPIKPKARAGRAVLQLEGVEEAEPAPVARITLNDCLACAGCVTSSETVLIAQQSGAEFVRQMESSSAKLTVVAISPASRAAIAAHTGLSLLETHRRLAGFLRGMGAHAFLDCGLATDLHLLQVAAEFISRYRTAQPDCSPSETAVKDSTGGFSGPLPMLTSSCPGWVCYAEKTQGSSILPFLSTVKSPQQIMGTLLKYAYAPKQGLTPQEVSVITVMPCFDKKLEASRDDFFNAQAGAEGSRDVDMVLSSAELLSVIEERAAANATGPFVNCPDGDDVGRVRMPTRHSESRGEATAPSGPTNDAATSPSFDASSSKHHPLAALPCANITDDAHASLVEFSSLLYPSHHNNGLRLGSNCAAEREGRSTLRVNDDAGRVDGSNNVRSDIDELDHRFSYASPGASGGAADFVFRVAAAELFGVCIPQDEPLNWVAGRNSDMSELTLKIEGEVKLRFVRAYGFRNIQNVVRRVKTGQCSYSFVEMMACPSGCANGGGQPRPPPKEAMQRATAVEAASVSSADAALRRPHENPNVQLMYSEEGYLAGGAFGARTRELLHTSYRAVADEPQDASHSLAIQW